MNYLKKLKKKISKITAIDKYGVVRCVWRADVLFWDDLSIILDLIEKEYWNCQLEFEYFN